MDDDYLYTCGGFAAANDFDPGPGKFMLTPDPARNSFISKLTTAGTFVWAKMLEGNRNVIDNLTIDHKNGICYSGELYGRADMDPGPGTCWLSGYTDANVFISRLTTDGDFSWAFNYGSTPGGFASPTLNSIAVDPAGNLYAAGFFTGDIDYDPDPALTSILSVQGLWDIYLEKFGTAALGIKNEQAPEPAIFMYPNPSTGKFRIIIPEEYRNAQLSISDLSGKVITQLTLTDPNTSLYLTSGSYVVAVNKDDKKKWSQQLIVM